MSNRDLQSLIDKFAEAVFVHGPEYETRMRELHQRDRAYSFLFGGFGCRYYYYKRWFSTQSSPLMAPPPQDQQVFDLLPSDVAVGLNNVINSLNGTKASIRSAQAWFMERSVFASALAEGLKDRVIGMDDSDSERQMHLVFLVTDILFQSFGKRSNPNVLDYEAFVFKPLLGSMLARIYHNPQNKEINQSRLQKILEFLESKEIYDEETVNALENEMIVGAIPPANLSLITGIPTQPPILPYPVPSAFHSQPTAPAGELPGIVGRETQMGSGIMPYFPTSHSGIQMVTPGEVNPSGGEAANWIQARQNDDVYGSYGNQGSTHYH